MAIRDILKMYSLPGGSTTEDGRMLALSLAEIQTELMALREQMGKSSGIPATAIANIDTSALEAAIAQLKPLPPQDLDLNPVFRSYEQTAQAIKELLGEVKTTNHRLMGSFGGGGGPSVVGLNDASGNRLVINSDGSINTVGGGGATGGATEITLAALLAEFRAKYDVITTARALYNTVGDHTLITPPVGQSLRPVWLYAQAKGILDTGTVLVIFTLGSSSYEVELTGSQPFAHGAVWEGTANQSLIVNTSSTAAVLVNADYRVF